MYPELKSSSQLAIISPYNYQVKTFKDRFREMFGAEAEKVVDINTVDGFQVNILLFFSHLNISCAHKQTKMHDSAFIPISELKS